MNKAVRALSPLATIFLIISLLIIIFNQQLKKSGFDTALLHGANILFLVLSLLSYTIQLRGLNNANPHVFVRSVMSGMMLKMVVCMVATFAYIYSTGNNYSKRSVFTALFLYLIYLSVEVYVIMKTNKKKNA